MINFRKIGVILILCLVSLGLLSAIYRVQKRIDVQIVEHQLRYSGNVADASPIVTFTTVALGSFRGLIADLLWIRAIRLQKSGDYFEMVQLARWMTDLQPNFSGATAYLAWNMAYNISVTTSNYAERWKWVYEGIKLLRDRALLYDPNNAQLYRELGWLFQHKIGDAMDDAHIYYKIQLALAMDKVIGANPDWELIAAAPQNKEQFLAQYEKNPDFAATLKLVNCKDYDEFFARASEIGHLPEKLDEIVAPEFYADLQNHLIAARLLGEFRMDPAYILEIHRQYGKLDWRLAQAHSLYWAKQGLKHDPEHQMCNFMVVQSLYDAFRAGQIILLDKENFNLVIIPNFNLAEAVWDAYVEFERPHAEELAYGDSRGYFLLEAVMLFYGYGRYAKANEYFKLLQKADQSYAEKTIEEVFYARWRSEISNAGPQVATNLIVGSLLQSCFYLALGEVDTAIANEKMAQTLYNFYMEHRMKRDAQQIEPYEELKRVAVENSLRSFPPALAESLRQRINENLLTKPDSN